MWLYRRHYLGGTVSSTVGDSGIGKTSLSLIEIVGLSIGRDLLGNEKLCPHRCWYHNGEDTRDEINLRLGAICEYYGLDQDEVRKNLTITCGLDMPVEVAAGSPPVVDKKLVQDIADAIVGEGFEVAVFDPLITVHQVNENGVEIRTVLRNVFARVANFTGCSIELPHHTRKLFPGVEEASADDARGSTEIKAAVRGKLNPWNRNAGQKKGRSTGGLIKVCYGDETIPLRKEPFQLQITFRSWGLSLI